MSKWKQWWNKLVAFFKKHEPIRSRNWLKKAPSPKKGVAKKVAPKKAPAKKKPAKKAPAKKKAAGSPKAKQAVRATKPNPKKRSKK